jgi:anti-sigma B factor antagonist
MNENDRGMRIAATGPAAANIAVYGEVDASTADRLRMAIVDAASKRAGELEVDLSAVTFMDSAGLRAIAQAAEALEPTGRGVLLRNVPRAVLRLIEVVDAWPSSPGWGPMRAALQEGPGMTSFERRFAPETSELRPQRAALREWLHDAGVDGEDATADVLAVTSELVTNGVLHDGGDLITVRAERQDGDVCIEVTTVDQPGRHPVFGDIADSIHAGRGLAIVHSLSHGYSVEMRHNERVTTCRVATTG